MITARLVILTLGAVASLSLAASDQVPQLISYQGRVAVSGVNYDGNGQFKFALLNAAGNATYWSNDGTSSGGNEPAAGVTLPVTKGLYSVLLGDATKSNMTIVPATVFTNADVHLRVWFSDGVSGFQKLTPDRRIGAVGYAMMADSVSDGAVTTAKIADGAVTAEKLAPGAVGGAQLANSTVTITAGNGLSDGGQVALGGSVTLTNAGVTSLAGGGGVTVDGSAGSVTLGSTATTANTAGAIVARDGDGNFSAGTITANLNGTATGFTGTLAGDVTGSQGATAISNAMVTGKLITGFASGAGAIAPSDSILSAINKLDGNVALRAPLASPTFTGTVLLPAGTALAAPLRLQSGPVMTTPMAGAVEFDGTNLLVTSSSATPTRMTVAFADSTITADQIPPGTLTGQHLAVGIGLTSPSFSTIQNTGILTLPTTTDVLVARETVDTLKNKSIIGTTNTVAASQLRTANADVVLSAAGPPAAGQVLTATTATTAQWQTPVQPKADRQRITVSTSTANTSYQDIATLTTHDLGEPGCYLVDFNCHAYKDSYFSGIGYIVLAVNGVNDASTERSFDNILMAGGDPIVISRLLTACPAGTTVTIRLKSSSSILQVHARSGSLTIDGIPQSTVK